MAQIWGASATGQDPGAAALCGRFRGRRIVEESTIDTFLTPDDSGSGLGWAMSADILPVESLPAGAFGHTGFTGTFALAVPDDELVVILLTNRQNLDVRSDGNYASVDALRRAVTALALDLTR